MRISDGIGFHFKKWETKGQRELRAEAGISRRKWNAGLAGNATGIAARYIGLSRIARVDTNNMSRPGKALVMRGLIESSVVLAPGVFVIDAIATLFQILAAEIKKNHKSQTSGVDVECVSESNVEPKSPNDEIDDQWVTASLPNTSLPNTMDTMTDEWVTTSFTETDHSEN